VNCLACRRMLLVSPREQSSEQLAHIAECEACARLLDELGDVDRQIERATLVPVPDGLAHRILLARRRKPLWGYSMAAAVALVTGISLMLSGIFDRTLLLTPIQAVGPGHPAIAAISLVVDDRAELAQSGDTAEMDHRLKELGLKLKAGNVHAYYGGKCHLSGGECGLIVLDAPDARANVVLVPGYPIPEHVLVADRRMIALASPAKSGAYIVVADSPKIARRMQKLFTRG